MTLTLITHTCRAPIAATTGHLCDMHYRYFRVAPSYMVREYTLQFTEIFTDEQYWPLDFSLLVTNGG